ncbi:zinc-binding dehydrogenase [Streptomyces erythrochromogenes]|uniref:zinc-binding dehydrogenase n=1 Tax=Streptomyces erythrochromogenes TaxID=285574 RepID=UPI003681DD7D
MATMLAGRLTTGGGGFAVEEVPVPEPGPGQVLVRVRAAGVCLSDVHLIQGMLAPQPLTGSKVTLGHETAGEVAVLGDGVTGLAEGDRVVLQAGEVRAGVSCTRGVNIDGGWAEYTVAAADAVVPLPPGIPFEQACVIPDAVSTPWAAITSGANVRPAEAVAVWGVGGLGAHAVQLLRMVGACPVIAVDPLPAARERALSLGADTALDPADPEFATLLRAAAGTGGVDAAFDFAGVPAARDQALASLAEYGRLVLVGLTDRPFTIQDNLWFCRFRQRVLGHYGSRPEDLVDLVRLVGLRRLDLSGSISGIHPLAEAAQAVEALERKEGNPIRLILKP